MLYSRNNNEHLSPRLQCLANMVPKGKVVADIGTDHAYLPCFLIKRGIAERAIAADLHPGPLEAARRHVAAADLTDKIEVRGGNGLETLMMGEASVVIIAGMGAGTIQGILDRGKEVLSTVSHLLLQPLEGAAGLRQFLGESGWVLVEEELVAEGTRIYECLLLVKSPWVEAYMPPRASWLDGRWQVEGSDEDSSEFLPKLPGQCLNLLGPLLIYRRHPLLLEVLERLLQREKQALIGVKQARQPEQSQIAVRENHIEQWLEVKKWLSQ